MINTIETGKSMYRIGIGKYHSKCNIDKIFLSIYLYYEIYIKKSNKKLINQEFKEYDNIK